jgi:hypothetical protein
LGGARNGKETQGRGEKDCRDKRGEIIHHGKGQNKGRICNKENGADVFRNHGANELSYTEASDGRFVLKLKIPPGKVESFKKTFKKWFPRFKEWVSNPATGARTRLVFELTVIKPDSTRRSYQIQNANEVADLVTNFEAHFRTNPAFEPDDVWDAVERTIGG